MPDVTIIGAGPAGSVAALLLARAGWRVTLLEQHRFPRDKVCGECLSALGMEVLLRLGLRGSLLDAGAVRLDRAAVYAPGGAALVTPLPQPMWGLSRRVLDDLLLQAARDSGATVWQPARCEAVAPGPVVRVRDLSSNRVDVSRPHWAIVADGKAAFSPPGRPPAPTGDFGIKTYFANVAGPRDRIELFGTGGQYGGLAPIEGGRWNAAFSVPARRLREHGGDVGSLFDEIVSENPVLSQRLRGAERVGPWLAAPLPRFAVVKDWPAGVVPVGNAAAALEPIGGEGMGLAVRSAELAAEALDAAHREGQPADGIGLRREFDRLWRFRRAACRAAAQVVSRPRTAGLAIRVGARSRTLTRVAMGWMGKGD